MTYEFVVSNTGTVRLTGVEIDDPMLADAGLGVDCPRDVLKPGSSMVCESEPYTITTADQASGGVRNVATATGDTPDGPVTSDESTVDVPTSEGGGLPNTGAGFTWWMPLAGLGLVGGGLALLLVRRRDDDKGAERTQG